MTERKQERVTVLALTYGEPPQPRFMPQFHYSLSILRRLTILVAPIPRPVLPLIAIKRGRLRAKEWRAQGYSSPLEAITHDQANALAAALEKADPSRDYDVRVAYEFRHPMLTDILDEMESNPPDKLMIVPIYLPESDFTTGISRRDLKARAQKRGQTALPEATFVSEFSRDEKVADLMAESALEQIAEAGWSESDCKEAGLILGAHGTILHPPEGIDTGLESTLHFFEMLKARLEPRFAHTTAGWLNHTLGGEWTQPPLDEAAADMAKRGIRRVVYYPFGFLADNTETQLEGRLVLRENREIEPLLLQCLNTWPPFIAHLADRVIERVEQSQ